MANSVKRVQFMLFTNNPGHVTAFIVNKHSIHSSEIHFHHETSLVQGGIKGLSYASKYLVVFLVSPRP